MESRYESSVRARDRSKVGTWYDGRTSQSAAAYDWQYIVYPVFYAAAQRHLDFHCYEIYQRASTVQKPGRPKRRWTCDVKDWTSRTVAELAFTVGETQEAMENVVHEAISDPRQ